MPRTAIVDNGLVSQQHRGEGPTEPNDVTNTKDRENYVVIDGQFVQHWFRHHVVEI